MVSKPLPIFFFQDGNFLICNHILFSATFVKQAKTKISLTNSSRGTVNFFFMTACSSS